MKKHLKIYKCKNTKESKIFLLILIYYHTEYAINLDMIVQILYVVFFPSLHHLLYPILHLRSSERNVYIKSSEMAKKKSMTN